MTLPETLPATATKNTSRKRKALLGRAAAAATVAAATAAAMIASSGAALATTSQAQAGGHAATAAGAPLNVAASPHAYGYPDATNTGVTAGTQLKSVPSQITSGPGWKWDSRGWVEVSGAGANLSNLSIRGNLDISASNVTVSNVNVVNTGNNMGISLRHTKNVTVKNSSVSSPYNSGSQRLQVAVKDVYGDSTGTTVQGNNIWNTDTAIQLGEGTVKDNYVHNLVYYTGDHVNGIVSDASNAPLTITHNTVFNPVSQTDAIALLEALGPQHDVVISDNLVAGGGYSIYGGANPGKWTPKNITITGNRIARTYFPKGGSYGPYTAVVNGTNGDTWSGNIWDDTGAAVPAP